ncbi:MFS transporter [Nonomuraea roseoviolacea]|uniref:MFS family permease n=1 Tax=Nonomuraea roseoviolacea subsp. carminata TaxID=160689 RepID=A0ABT1KFX1_9ACTN|nr:MFS transporter [Nonomuraea roseoviolacea]MCP2352908.1 MFS family permease [Nonomuraea roseoviolacea subsp. carminata]
MWRRFASFGPGVRLLMVNQLAINIGFYMLMPYLAGHLADGLGLAAWTVGLVLGVRNLSQQGLFLLGGTLADRLGHRPVIIAGCLLRTVAFALLGVADALPALVAASAMTGFAGALFNPAVRACLAHGSGGRRVEAFALFNVFYQTGILAGPVIGLALLSVDFRLVCAVAAAVFGLLTLLQLLALPPCRAEPASGAGVLTDWRAVVANRPFLLFSAAMAGSYVLSFQVYLALPLLLGDAGAVGSLFVVSALVAIAGQLRITDWARRRWSGPRAVVRGLALMAVAFLPLVPAGATPSTAARVAAVLACTALLAAGTALTYPFEMDTVVALSGERLVATHYGLYNTVAGVGVTLGNLVVGALLGAGSPAPAGAALFLLGAACAVAVGALNRTGRLTAPEPATSRR